MGTCFTRCYSNRTILENQPESDAPGRFKTQRCKKKIFFFLKKHNPTSFISLSADIEGNLVVSLYDYPSLEHTELTMHMGEKLTVVSE